MEKEFNCSICLVILTRDQVKCRFSANYCSEFCKRMADLRYDAYVDPRGAYEGKAERELEER